MLIEVAKGVDIQKDILDQMEFTPLIAEDLIYTDTAMYSDGPAGLKALIDAKES
jgi:propionate CoA-transferase